MALATIGRYTRAVRRDALALVAVALVALIASAALTIWHHARQMRVLEATSRYHLPTALALSRIEADAADLVRAGPGAGARLAASMDEVRRLHRTYGGPAYGAAMERLEATWEPVAALREEAGRAAGDVLAPFLAEAEALRTRHEAAGRRLVTRAEAFWGPWNPTLGLPLVLLLGVGAAVGQRLVRRISRATLRQQAVERALRRTEDGHARAEAIAHMGHWSWDPRTNRSHRSAEVYRILGRSPDAVGDTLEGFLALVHPDDVETVRTRVAEGVASGKPYLCRFRVVRPDGGQRWVEAHAEVIPDPETGRPARLVGTLTDVTERARAEEALRASEQRFRQIFDHAPIGIGVGGADGRIIDANPAFLSMMRCSAEDLRGKRFGDLTHPDDMPRYRAFLEAAQAGAEGTIDKRYLRADGEVAWGRLTLRFVRDADGQLVHGVGMVEDITGRKAMTEALKESEERLRQVTENVGEVFWMNDPPCERTLYISPAYETIWGRTRESLYRDPKSWLEGIHPDDRERVYQGAMAARAAEVPYEHTYRIVRPDGTERMIHGRGYPVRDEDGRVYRWAGASADITELRRLQTALEESEARLRQVTDTIQEVFWVVLPDGTVLYVSAAYETIWGRSREEVYREPTAWQEAVHPDDRERVRAQQAWQMEAQAEIVYRIVRPDGGVRWIRDRSYPIRDAEGAVYRVVGVATDITEQKRAETALRQQEERTRLILDSTAEAIYGVDLEGCCTFANAACLRQLGYDREEELLGRDMHALLQHGHDEGSPCFGPKCEVREAIRHGRGYHAGDCSVLRAAGMPLAVDCWSHPLRREGELVGAVVTFVDATARRQAEAERRHYEDELARVARLATMGEMASGLAHQINQPLAAISAFAQGSIQRLRQRQGGEGSDGVVESLEQIARQAGRAGDIVRHLRELVGKGKERRAPEDVNVLVTSAARLMEPEAARNGVTLRLDLAADLPKAWVDRIGLDQVLINLMKNAIEALADAGARRRLTLSTGRTGTGAVAVTVADNGPGLPPAAADRLFHPFFTTKPDGLGLGLAVSRSIIEAHGGTLTAVETKGPGARFRFTLPVRDHG
jgi:PAS domain S-box-containing protein